MNSNITLLDLIRQILLKQPNISNNDLRRMLYSLLASIEIDRADDFAANITSLEELNSKLHRQVMLSDPGPDEDGIWGAHVPHKHHSHVMLPAVSAVYEAGTITTSEPPHNGIWGAHVPHKHHSHGMLPGATGQVRFDDATANAGNTGWFAPAAAAPAAAPAAAAAAAAAAAPAAAAPAAAAPDSGYNSLFYWPPLPFAQKTSKALHSGVWGAKVASNKKHANAINTINQAFDAYV
jgi:hypothetical protein